MKVIATLTAVMFGLLCTADITAQGFEGSIGFTKNVGPVVAQYTYQIKDDMVRVEELDNLGEVQGIMIINTKTNTVVALSPERRLYLDVPNRRKTNSHQTEVKTTGKKETINGYECEEWLVKSSEDGREVSYWVAAEDFDFFLPMLKTLNRKDKMAHFYMDLPNAAGGFPMKGTETKRDGMELTKLEVDLVNKEELSAELFEIPADYSKFERETSN